MSNADTLARREKLMMLGFANLIAVGFLHASPSDFMRSLPPFAQLEGKTGFTLPEDLRVAYEAVKSKDPAEEKADNEIVFSLGGYIAHSIFNGRVNARIGVAALADIFNTLLDTVPLANVDGVTQIKDWMRRAGEDSAGNADLRDAILEACRDAGLFLEEKTDAA